MRGVIVVDPLNGVTIGETMEPTINGMTILVALKVAVVDRRVRDTRINREWYPVALDE